MKSFRNDTNGHGYCGPTILGAITGKPLSKVLDTIREGRARRGYRTIDSRGRPMNVGGTTTQDVRDAFAKLGWRMSIAANFTATPIKKRITVAAWLRSRKPHERKLTYVLVIGQRPGSPGSSWEGGHWVAVTAKKFADTFTKGEWVWLKDAPHRRKRVKEVWVVSEGASPVAGTPGPRIPSI